MHSRNTFLLDCRVAARLDVGEILDDRIMSGQVQILASFLRQMSRLWRKERFASRQLTATVTTLAKDSNRMASLKCSKRQLLRAPDAPDAPGRWQLTDENGAGWTVRIKECNGTLYASIGSLAIPVHNLRGRWGR